MQDDVASSKTEAAYRLLRREILTTKLMPGAPLRLGALRKTYGIGWTPLREALSRLSWSPRSAIGVSRSRLYPGKSWRT